MATVNSISADTWCKSADVQDKVDIKVGQSPGDFEKAIKEATDTLQTWWSDATGKEVGHSDMPTTDNELADLLQQSTAWLAAHEAALKQGGQLRNDGDGRSMSFKDMAETKFDNWETQANLDPEDADGSDVSGNSEVTARTGQIDPFSD